MPGMNSQQLVIYNAAVAAVSGGYTAPGGIALAKSPRAGDSYGVPYQDYFVKVPEPGFVILLGIGLLAASIAACRRRE